MQPAERPACVGPELTQILEAPEGWAADFQTRQALVARDLIDPGLLATLIERCRAGRFIDDYVGGIGSRQVEAPQRVGRVLNLALSRPNFLSWVEQATGMRPLAKVEGRVVQLRANGADQLAWHNDMDGHHRMLGVTIDLSDAPFAGGAFELRETRTGKPLLRFDHDNPGTALIFTVSPALEHRVLPLTSGGPRRVFSGWFFDSERA
jgi:hypothetical protein